MSGICGIVQPDEAALHSAMERLLDDLTDFGPAVHRWQAPPVAFGQRQDFIYRRDRLEHQPVTVGHLTVIADARLIDADTVATALGLPPGMERQTADSELIARAWQRWGEQALDRLDGEFCFAVWDTATQRLTLVRDPLGNRPLYYAQGPQGLAFSTSLAGLVCLPWVDLSLDEHAIADYLGAVATEDASTPYRGIRRLPPGSMLTWTDTAGSWPRLRRYWHITTAAHVHLPTADDYVQAVKARVQKVIAHCCDTEHEVGLILSGGLDSSTLAALAAAHLAGQDRQLLTASSVLPVGHTGPARDERPHVEALCARYANIVPHWVTAEDRRLLAGADEDLARRGQPPWNAFAVMDNALHETLLSAGARVVLDGLHGDSVWSFEHPVFPLDFLLRGQPLTAWREWAALSRRYRIGRRRLAKLVVAPYAAWLPTWHGNARERLTRHTGPTSVAPDLARRTHLARRAQRARSRGWPMFTLRTAQRFDLASAVWPRLREELARSAAARGQSHRSPLWDRQIVTLCLSAPPQALQRDGLGRALVRTIGVGILPETVRTRIDKGAFLPDFHARVLREQQAIRAVVEAARASPTATQYIDFKTIEAALDALTGEVPVHRWTLEAQSVIVRGQAMARFLQLYESSRLQQSVSRAHGQPTCADGHTGTG